MPKKRLTEVCSVDECCQQRFGQYRMCREHLNQHKTAQRNARQPLKPKVIPTICSVDGCEEPRHFSPGTGRGGKPRMVGSQFCYLHFREHEKKAQIRRKKEETRDEYEKRLSKKRDYRKHRRATDPSFVEQVKTYRRSQRIRHRLQAWCTKAYLKAAASEDKRLESSLRKWLAECEQGRRKSPGYREQLRLRKNQQIQEMYWRDPDKYRQRSQARKHANPEYRERWAATRGKRERELSDGTITREAVCKMFEASKRCPYCGDDYSHSRRSLDHIIPLARANGRKLHSLSNLIVCCFKCNYTKRTKSLEEYLSEIKGRHGRQKRYAPAVGQTVQMSLLTQ